jgi:DNA-binding IclR family transcriptional regulator
MTDIATILAAMQPGREYTMGDIEARTKLPRETVANALKAMVRAGKLNATDLKCIGIYSLPKGDA